MIFERSIYLINQKIRPTFVYIHINKCGGTSIEHALSIPKIHDTAQQRKNFLGDHSWAKAKKFSIVRNPFTRVHSLYRYRLNKNHNQMRDNEVVFQKWFDLCFKQKDVGYYNNPLMFAPCSTWLCDEHSAVMVDMVLKLEEIKERVVDLQKFLGREINLVHKNATISRSVNEIRSELGNSRIKILEEHFRSDFEIFGY